MTYAGSEYSILMGIILHHYSYLVEKADESKKNLISIFSLITCGKREDLWALIHLQMILLGIGKGILMGEVAWIQNLFPLNLSPMPAGSYNMEGGI